MMFSFVCIKVQNWIENKCKIQLVVLKCTFSSVDETGRIIMQGTHCLVHKGKVIEGMGNKPIYYHVHGIVK